MNIVSAFRRHLPGFSDLFGVAASDVLSSMDRALDDIPNQPPAIAMALDAVGIHRREVIVAMRDPFQSGDVVHAACTTFVGARLPISKRGIHVSRLSDLLAAGTTEVYPDLLAYARALAHRIAACQYGHATVALQARIPYLEAVDTVGSRSKLSLETVRLSVRLMLDDGAIRTDIGIGVSHIVACPCVQQTYRHALRAKARARGDAAIDSTAALMTHSQRCQTFVMVHRFQGCFELPIVLAALDSVLVRTRATQPRDAELSCVYRAHQAPQFIEDALRAAVVAVGRLWPSSGAFARITGRARSQESIHDFDLTSRVRLTHAQLQHL